MPSQLGRTTGGGAAALGGGGLSPVEPPISHRRGGRPTGGRQSPGGLPPRPVGRLPAAHRSGRVSGIRPSDRRGPGPAGHRGRNVRSTGRCSYNLRITRRRADSCGLHRSTSQVIRRSGSGVCFFFLCRREISTRRRRVRGRTRRSRAWSVDVNHLSVDAWSGVAARGRSANWSRAHAATGSDEARARPASLAGTAGPSLMILPQVHLRKPCYDFYFL